MNKIKFWIDNSRYISLPQSILPAVLAIAMATQYADFSWWLSLIALFGVIFAHLGMNLADDYFDYKQKTTEIRQKAKEEGVLTHMDKCHYILSGKATVKQLAWAVVCFLAIAGLAGVVVFYFRGKVIALLALIGLFLGIFYSARPLKLSYRGLGELVIGLMFGPLLMTGVQYAACGVLNWQILLVSVAVGLLVTNIVYTHSVLDYRTDAQSHKKTFAHLMKTNEGMIAALAVFTFLPFVLVLLGVGLGYLHWAALFVFLLLPMCFYLVYSVSCHLYGTPVDMHPKWWMGPMGDFEKYRAANMDWFLIRWLVARNIVTFFCLILSLVFFIL